MNNDKKNKTIIIKAEKILNDYNKKIEDNSYNKKIKALTKIINKFKKINKVLIITNLISIVLIFILAI